MSDLGGQEFRGAKAGSENKDGNRRPTIAASVWKEHKELLF